MKSAGLGLLALTILAGNIARADEHGHAAHWSYQGETAPAHWGDLESGFGACKLGKEQSPVDIATQHVEKASLAPIATHYQASAAEVVNNGHTIQANVESGGSAILQGREYQLVQFHFHTPSVEKVDGRNSPMVAHLVHRNADGALAVIAILIKEGDENPALRDIFENLPKDTTAPTVRTAINVQSLFPASLTYYAFKGSLTTPPCTEGVAWHVLATPITMSATQVNEFRRIYKMNARPTQPLNGRVVQVGG